jgi:4-diphosphocytidyl-2-C-methyl-D-erythritol kinase
VKKTTILAPAKVNYRLDVLRKRPDGYHDLRMIMQRIDLCDEITLSVSGAPGIRVTCGREGVPDGPANIAWRAAELLLKEAGVEAGVEIDIVKRIPVAAGLGGGSSDGASVLMGLNELLGLGFPDGRLMEIGVKIGADVPFFIFRKAALAEGVGEILSEIEAVPAAWIVLVNPNAPVSTAWVYGNLQLTNRGELRTIPRFFETVPALCAVLSNDLETVTVGRFPVIAEIKDRLLAAGAAGALMSGSGPTVFGIFEEEGPARETAESLKEETGWFTTAVRTL